MPLVPFAEGVAVADQAQAADPSAVVQQQLGCLALTDTAYVDKLKLEVKKDESLEKCTLMADKGESGFIWKEGLLFP